MPFFLRKDSNSSLVRLGPLSETSTSGTPKVAKIPLKHWIVGVDSMDGKGCASIHLEWASMRIKNMWLRNGPAKSIWTLLHGLVGQVHGWRGVTGREDCWAWHKWQFLTVCSISLSIPDHHTKVCAILFMRLAPGWESWSFCNIRERPASGTTTRLPHNRQPSWDVNWVCLLQKGWRLCSVIVDGQPDSTYWVTRDRIGSFLVQAHIIPAVTTPSLSCSINNTVSDGRGVDMMVSCNSRRLRASALVWSVEHLCTIR